MNIQVVLNMEFSRAKSETQLIIRFKEITMIPGETPWELDQRLKGMVQEANMTLTNGQHCAWFIASLTLHQPGTENSADSHTQEHKI